MSRTMPVTSANDSICCAPLTNALLSAEEATSLAQVFAALSDPIRLRLLSIVASEGESCSCNLEGPLERSQPTVSHHTKILADVGLLIGDKRGKWVWWRVNTERLDMVRQVLGGV